MKKILGLFPIAIAIISILLLIYILFKSGIFLENSKKFGKIYYIIPIFLLSVSLISFFLSESVRINISLTFLVLSFSFYIFETYLSLQISPDKQKAISEYNNKNKNKFDTRNKFQIYSDLKKKNGKIALPIPPKVYANKKDSSFLPISGVSNTETINCNENGYYSIIESDKYGFNNPNADWNKEIVDFVLVGDSFVYGSCVNRPNDIASNLRTLNKNKNGILNLGYIGNGPLTSYIALREYLQDKKVNNILFFFYEENDMNDLRRELSHPLLNRYLLDLKFSQNLIKKQKIIDEVARKSIIEEEKKFFNRKLVEFIKVSRVRGLFTFFKQKTKEKEDPKTEFKKILKLTNEFAKEKKSNIYFIYLPSYQRFSDDKFIDKKEIILDTAYTSNINVIDIHSEIFENHNDPLSLFPFRINGHYTNEGYKKISKKIYKIIYN